MENMFIEARRKIKLDKAKLRELEKILPEKVMLVYSIQYKDMAQEVKNKINKKIIGFSQVLGCSELKSDYPILYIGSGRFHALNLALSSEQEVFIFGNSVSKIDKKEIEKQKAKEKGKYLKFLSAKSAGILVSLKPGQENLEEAIKLKKSLNKKSYIFLANNINPAELENFSIDSWINTACPDMSNDSQLVNYKKIKFKN